MHGYGWFMSMRQGDEKPKVTRALLLRVLNYAKPYWWHIGGMLMTILLSTGLSLVTPLIFRQLIDHILPSKDINQLTLFDTPSGYAELDKRMASTYSNKGSLLPVLKFPELPMHNNPAELAARGRVRKRDVSFGPRTEDGKQAWDTFMTLAATTQKLNVSFYKYVRDRILKKNIIPPLSELIQKAARELMQRQLYSLACP
jgi:ABC-type multidrug transport system fused ATPase/permease subunit